MAIKITETITRMCCTHKDFISYKGEVGKDIHENIKRNLVFCKHCGQVWFFDSAQEPGFKQENKKLCVTFCKD